MRAAVCRSHGEPLTIEDVTVGEPGPAEVRVDIAACAICHSDVIYADGGWGGDTPIIFGHEAAGTIESVGSGVTGLERGDRVVVTLMRTCGECYHCLRGEDSICIGEFADVPPFVDASGVPIVRGLKTGAFAEQTVVHQSQVFPIPDEMSMATASLLACGLLTGFGAVVNTAAVPSGSSVVVIGVGGVGLGAVQGALHAGAETVIAVDLLDDKLATALQFGATGAVNGRENAIESIHALTGGIGPDYVFVAVGAGVAVDQGLAMVRRGGAVVLVGMPGSGVMTEFETVELADGAQRIIGSKMGSASLSRDIPLLVDLYAEGDLPLDDMVSGTFPLERINEAIDEVKAGSVIRNVVLFD